MKNEWFNKIVICISLLILISCKQNTNLKDADNTIQQISNERLEEIEEKFKLVSNAENISFQIEHETVEISNDLYLAVFFGDQVIYYGKFKKDIQCKVSEQNNRNILSFYLIKIDKNQNQLYIWTCDSGTFLNRKADKVKVTLIPDLDQYCDYKIQ